MFTNSPRNSNGPVRRGRGKSIGQEAEAMHRLIVNPDTPEAWEIALVPGMNFAGRGEENEARILHDSVSSAHCEISVVNSCVIVKDLGSERGTFIDGQRVREGELRHGQILQLGEVLMRCEFDNAAGPINVALPGARESVAPTVCRIHRETMARYKCSGCGSAFCEACVSLRPDRAQTRAFCRSCGAECATLSPVNVAPAEETRPFSSLVSDAFSYPFKGDGGLLLIAGGVVLLLMDAAAYVAGFAWLIGLAAVFILTVFGMGFVVSYLRSILTRTAAGEERMPEWPDTSDFSNEIVTPFLQLLATVLVCFGPAILVHFAVDERTAWGDPLLLGLIFFGAVYFPMAFMAVAMFDSIAALNPLLVIRSILRIRGSYFLTMLLFGGVLLLQWLAADVLPGFLKPGLGVRLILWIISNFVGLYLLTAQARLLGLVYRSKQNELGWFASG